MAAPVHLPDVWTAEDQLIIESLLFDAASAGEASAKTAPSPTAEPATRMSVAMAGAIQTVQRWRRQPPSVAVSHHVGGASAQEERMLQRSLQYRRQIEERRRAKHREVQRRFVQRKKEQRDRVKQELKRLEKEKDVLQLVSEEKRLGEDNRALREEVATKEPVRLPTRDQIQKLLEDQLELIRSHYKPLTTDEWDEMRGRNLQEMEAAGAESGFESTGAVVFGWSDKRRVDYESGCSKFVLTKRFPQLDALAFRDLTWDKLQLEETHQQLFHAAVAIRTQVVQRVDDCGVVLHRVMFNPVTGSVVHAIEATMRVRYGREFVLFQRSLDYNAAFECVPRAHKWMRLLTSLVYSPVAAHGGCVFRYAGILRDLAPVDIQYWLMEMLWVILRFESVMVAPLFSLTSSS